MLKQTASGWLNPVSSHGFWNSDPILAADLSQSQRKAWGSFHACKRSFSGALWGVWGSPCIWFHWSLLLSLLFPPGGSSCSPSQAPSEARCPEGQENCESQGRSCMCFKQSLSHVCPQAIYWLLSFIWAATTKGSHFSKAAATNTPPQQDQPSQRWLAPMEHQLHLAVLKEVVASGRKGDKTEENPRRGTPRATKRVLTRGCHGKKKTGMERHSVRS